MHHCQLSVASSRDSKDTSNVHLAWKSGGGATSTKMGSRRGWRTSPNETPTESGACGLLTAQVPRLLLLQRRVGRLFGHGVLVGKKLAHQAASVQPLQFTVHPRWPNAFHCVCDFKGDPGQSGENRCGWIWVPEDDLGVALPAFLPYTLPYTLSYLRTVHDATFRGHACLIAYRDPL